MSDEFNKNIFEENNSGIQNNNASSDNMQEQYVQAHSSDEQNNQDQNNQNQNNQDQNNQSTYRFWAEQITSPKEYYNSQYNDEQNHNSNHTNSEEDTQSNTNSEGNSQRNSNVFDMSSKNEKPKKNRKRGFLKKAGKLVLNAAVIGLIAGTAFIGFNWIYYKINPDAPVISINIGNNFSLSNNKLNFNPTIKPENQIAATTISQKTIQQNTDITDIVDSAMPSIVTINSTFAQSYDVFGQQYNGENQGSGSGIIIGKNDKELLIATNNHVVENAESITVAFKDNKQAKAIIKGTDAVADLAVVSIDLKSISEETMKSIKVATLGDSESVKVGQMAIAIGNALGYGQSVTVGYISAKDRKVEIDGKTMVLLQTDAAINPGNSGGALLNLKGEVIGINSVKYASSGVEGMGYAIPISRATPIINELKNRETLAADEKGYLGVYIKQVTQEISDMYNWPIGIYVISTVEGSSAAKAGIIAGDIITKVNGTEVTAESQLQEKISSYRAGTKVTLTVMRMKDGKYSANEVEVTLGKSSSLDISNQK